jgi:hypothetical protein
VTNPRQTVLSGHGRAFLLVNLFGFPAASFVLLPALAWLATAAAAPLWLFLALPVAVGLALLAVNVWLVGAAWRAHGWGGEAAAMSAWTGLCVLTFAMLGAFSPLNLALRLAIGGMAPTGL